MKKVGIVSGGLTKFTKEDAPIESLMGSAIRPIFEENDNLKQKDIDVVLTSTNANNKYLANIISEFCGISPKIAHSVESLCNSGTNSIVSAYAYIQSGLANTALIVGGENVHSPGLVLEWDKSRSQYKHPIYWASMFTSSYMKKYDVTLENLSYVSAKNHRNAVDNPFACFEHEYSVDDVMKSKHLTENIRLLDCSMSCSGAGAILLASENTIKKFTDNPVWIKGIGQKSISAGFTKNNDFTSMVSTSHSASNAYKMSGKNPSDIDVAELHDAFSICEIIELEDLGFVKKGKGVDYVKQLFETHDKKINPRGGLIGSGHPLGATGIAQTIEIVKQLQGNAGKRQVKNSKVGLVHNMSAAATSSTVLILET